MKLNLFRILVVLLGVSVLWIVYWSGYQAGYVKVKNEQYSTIYLAAAEKLHFLKALGDDPSQSLKNSIKSSIKGNIAELESLDTYLQRFDGLHIWDRIYHIPMLPYLASRLYDVDEDRKSMLAALKNEAAKIEKNLEQGTK